MTNRPDDTKETARQREIAIKEGAVDWREICVGFHFPTIWKTSGRCWEKAKEGIEKECDLLKKNLLKELLELIKKEKQ